MIYRVIIPEIDEEIEASSLEEAEEIALEIAMQDISIEIIE